MTGLKNAVLLLGAAVMGLIPNLALADTIIVSDAPEAIELTIYRDNLALITETRKIDLPAGRTTIEFEGVNDRMISETAVLEEFGAISIERNFDFNLLGKSSLFQNAIGETVVLTRTDKATGNVTRVDAEVISAERGVLLQLETGEIEAFGCSALPERVDFYDLPENLQAKPTLSLIVEKEEAGEEEMTLSYLAGGFDWQSDYVLTLNETPDENGEMTAALAGWLTLENGTAISIEDAPTSVIAGDLRRLGSTDSRLVQGEWFNAYCWPKGSTKTGVFTVIAEPPKLNRAPPPPPAMALLEFADESSRTITVTASIAKREDFGDYKLYRLPLPTSVNASQVKQVRFLENNDIDVTEVFSFKQSRPLDYSGELPRGAWLEYHIDNDKEGTLAEPLPAGTYRMMAKSEAGRSIYIGEDDQRDLAVGLPVEIAAGDAFDVMMAVEGFERKASGSLLWGRQKTIYTVSYTLTNALDRPVRVQVSLGEYGAIAYDIVETSHEIDTSRPGISWWVTIPPESVEVINYTAEVD